MRDQTEKTEIRITREFGGYNHRRYSRPWIARITSWPIGQRPELEWGRWLGRDGDDGLVEIAASPGDVIRWGQKDHRGNRGENRWGIVTDEGEVRECSAEEAREHYNS